MAEQDCVDNFGIGATSSQCINILTKVAKRHSYSPFVDVLVDLETRYLPDETLFSTMGSRYFGDDKALANVFLRKQMIAGVARAFKPGCKVDSVVVLHGKEGCGKGTFLNTLFGLGMVCSDFGAITCKDEKAKLSKFACIELAEIGRMLKSYQVEVAKSFVTNQVDTFRPPYGVGIIDHPRASTLWGSSNEKALLDDAGGDGRRWWMVDAAGIIRNDLVAEERGVLWASAIAAYKAGELWHLDKDEYQEQKLDNLNYRNEDVNAISLHSGNLKYHKADSVNGVYYTTQDVHMLLGGQNVPNKVEQMSIAKLLISNGCVRERPSINGIQRVVFTRAEAFKADKPSKGE